MEKKMENEMSDGNWIMYSGLRVQNLPFSRVT